MDISFVVTAMQLFIIVPGIFLASYLAFVSPSEMMNTFISVDQNVRAKISKNILHIGIITVSAFGVYFAFGGLLLMDSPSWFKKGEYRTILMITAFHLLMSLILLLLLYYIYRNQRLRFLLKEPKRSEVGSIGESKKIERSVNRIKVKGSEEKNIEDKKRKTKKKAKDTQNKTKKKN